MHIRTICIKNYRRLKDVRIDLEKETTIFVGSNNSGKTSAAQALLAFLKSKSEGENVRLSLYDFSVDCWAQLDKIGNGELPPETPLPAIRLDLWFEVTDSDLHYVVNLLPNLDWAQTLVGVRLEFGPKNEAELLKNFKEANADGKRRAASKRANGFCPWPTTLSDYLMKRLHDEYKIFYYVLDHSCFDKAFVENPGYRPAVLGDARENGAAIMSSLLQVDFLGAQRHQADVGVSMKGGKLAKRLNEFYKRNKTKNDEDIEAVAALAQSEDRLNEHMKQAFEPILSELNKLGYPGLADPHLVIKSALNPDTILTENARVHYELREPGASAADSPPFTLPDTYNGLGFKNLIYMVIELLESQRRWEEEEENRPPLHLIIIEEPEAHLHAQMQQVFIKKMRELLRTGDQSFLTQVIVTTHSSHIVYESNFDPIRYFRRASGANAAICSEVLNLSDLQPAMHDTREFLLQYMKLTHCDLFFADAAILVEGNVERLLLPLMIERDESLRKLKSRYLSIIEIGGAYAYRFKELIDFLGVTTLVITDLDSVVPGKPKARAGSGSSAEDVAPVHVSASKDDDGGDEPSDQEEKEGSACMTDVPGALTSNETLKKLLPQMRTIEELLKALPAHKVLPSTGTRAAKVRMVYQTQETVNWWNKDKKLAGRTFEDAFAFENLMWCQDEDQKALDLRVKRTAYGVQRASLEEVTKRVHRHIRRSSFNKTNFALALIMLNSKDWKSPAYIVEGLKWLTEQLFPNETPSPEEASAESEAAE